MDQRYLDDLDPDVNILDGDAMEVSDRDSGVDQDRSDTSCMVNGSQQHTVVPMEVSHTISDIEDPMDWDAPIPVAVRVGGDSSHVHRAGQVGEAKPSHSVFPQVKIHMLKCNSPGNKDYRHKAHLHLVNTPRAPTCATANRNSAHGSHRALQRGGPNRFSTPPVQRIAYDYTGARPKVPAFRKDTRHVANQHVHKPASRTQLPHIKTQTYSSACKSRGGGNIHRAQVHRNPHEGCDSDSTFRAETVGQAVVQMYSTDKEETEHLNRALRESKLEYEHKQNCEVEPWSLRDICHACETEIRPFVQQAFEKVCRIKQRDRHMYAKMVEASGSDDIDIEKKVHFLATTIADRASEGMRVDKSLVQELHRLVLSSDPVVRVNRSPVNNRIRGVVHGQRYPTAAVARSGVGVLATEQQNSTPWQGATHKYSRSPYTEPRRYDRSSRHNNPVKKDSAFDLA